MKVSVIICTYADEMYEHFQDAVESIENQTYDDIEMVLVSDGNQAVYERMQADYNDQPNTIVTRTAENVGISAARNHGVEKATGDVVAQIDDDAIADPHWVEELVSVYEDTDAVAVGGKMVPEWVDDKPSFLPEEFYWLIGVTHRGFAEPGEEVRNTFGSNISFRKSVFEKLNGYNTDIGRKGGREIQAEEPEIGIRLQDEFESGVFYNPEAKVAHKIFEYRTDPIWIAKRAFWQGYSKRGIKNILPDAGPQEESHFLLFLLVNSLPQKTVKIFKQPSIKSVNQLIWLIGLTGIVGLGYVYGIIRWRMLERL
ncbi:glycosyl transferase family 2 [Halodesulfurarchaeum formicicum]|uniref:Glycosyl transferase family 2 n=1 Tax=Halodesulfurarchaeum formicicum TaxID=1873524 RepID=A0A1D8S3V0_9EURY|nr:glucosyl-dolichyl phosphate glucuronosyltransferase [Halodesulfurarchaeum formicicum]AOW80032.1 glycosyl transferase family 2 [Halodesulfurarchaeum formicicum]